MNGSSPSVLLFLFACFYNSGASVTNRRQITPVEHFTEEEVVVLPAYGGLAPRRREPSAGNGTGAGNERRRGRLWHVDSILHPEDDVRFLLYTRSSYDSFEQLITDDADSVKNSKFAFERPTKIVVHGWLSAGSKDYCGAMKDAYLAAEDVNVVAVDWPAFRPYTLARLAVRPVARAVARFLDFLLADRVGVERASVHLLGHSLGAHIAGIAARATAHRPLPRITGFDPAGPLFSGDADNRLDSSDAEFVDVIHTSGGYLGYLDPIGHLDFYPNGGTPVQPGCGFDLGICSHSRSYEYYIASLLSPDSAFLAVPCDNYVDFQGGRCCSGVGVMGYRVDRRSRGKYYLLTGGNVPYALGRAGIVPSCWSSPARFDE